MSPPTDGVAQYIIRNQSSTLYATLADRTPQQWVTQKHDMGSDPSQIWQVSYNIETSMATIKNKGAGNYAVINDLTHFVVGDASPQEFELIPMSGVGNYYVIQVKNSDRVWHVAGSEEGAKLVARSDIDPKEDYANWWSFTLLPGAVSEGEGTTSL
ncbi:hypothetical protein DEU56DRAFT_80391 [Suillus clintonianus]|uniref:uncharacterized protein n=1 Tax=Suillus clintonianus TaxID=1904413 RepID=UPI001B872A8A|nr:uncharacterized protein DEU56DRAFT_80391 [Suillus clintonianus]KAG2148779.1 hypothetical protein DEU56DRAFT_80391 [Suillus clintonianus]